MGRRRHQRRPHHRERGAAPGGGRSTGALALSRCSRSRSSRRFQEGAGRLAEHGGGSGDPEQDRAPLHCADDRRLAQCRRARRDRRLRARSSRRQGVKSLLPGANGARTVRLGHDPRAVRRGARLSLPNPEEVQEPNGREREVRSALHQDRSGECRRRDRSELAGCRIARSVPDQGLLRRGRRVPGGHALHGDTAEWGCHALPIPPGLRRKPSRLASGGPLDVIGGVHRHSPPLLARRTVRGLRDERPLAGAAAPGPTA